eukprot:CAMPEP_0185802906 /NCGR_PEP_ID=MMETSP1322-20130828/2276_1 /TAXON_ID=265543 /ORGANISM="Minutocellus polymorphus, Strain RCC2270" /LENGTH=387 /DNA_ID=CAMNT_0028498713 /DNA_START=178 /DNA_END=1341 /DNA_ORIENTATION=-
MFGSLSQQSGAGELLFSGGGGGLTHGRSGSSGDAPQAAGPPGPIGGLGSGTSSFDLSNDFPTLGGGGPGLGGIGAGAIGGGLAGNMRQQQLLQQQQYRMATAGQGSINIAAEDFPALGGGASAQQAQQRNGSNPLANLRGGADAGIGGLAAIGGPTSNGGSNPILNGLAGGIASLNIHDASSLSGGSSGVGITKSSSSGGGPDGAPGTAINSEYGLLGLLGIIRITDADRNALALGQDLSALGLNLEPSANKLLDAFGGPFTDKAATKDFRYNIPACYFATSPQLKTGQLSRLNLDSLFYMFYGLPKDSFQAHAAQELYRREWRYHTESKVWFKRAVPGDGVDLGDGSPKYIYFDYTTWDRQLFNGNVQQIVGGFLSEDDVRVPANQ